MADDVHLSKLKEGVTAWNEWRPTDPKFQADLTGADLTHANLTSANLKSADLKDADLTNADLRDADLTYADLTAANLTDAKLRDANLTDADLLGADLTRANLMDAKLRDADLTDADLSGADLTRADLGGADLGGADLTGAVVENAVFGGTTFDSETQGLDRLTEDQRAGLVSAEQDADAVAQSDAPGRAAQITVGAAKRIIGPAHEVLIGLSIPNDLSEAHRDLFLELLRTVEDLQQSLAGLRDETRPLFDENEEFRKKLAAALPLWKRAWETFVLKSAEGAGTSVGKGAVFTAGFIAGMISSAFAAEPLGIPI